MRRLIAIVALLACSCASATRYGRLAVEDVKGVATAPAHATAKQWQHAAAAVAGVAATTLVDDEIRDLAERNHSHALDEFTRLVEPLGGGRSNTVMLGFLLYGVVRNDSRAKMTAFDSYMSSVIASLAITPAIKHIANRRRPNGGDLSFPSGHTTEAFALATSIAEMYPASRYVVYGLAGSVGFARIYHNAHWASDVAAGAIIGSAVGHTVARTNRAQWKIVPVRRGAAITISW
ncbi:MAG TPA: phosphatase PAP2 family protein [Thermoanaerobaculia bacterium]|nr:phosphatase PAP2 family protein [Thermoanaerobaculia bacterium]